MNEDETCHICGKEENLHDLSKKCKCGSRAIIFRSYPRSKRTYFQCKICGMRLFFYPCDIILVNYKTHEISCIKGHFERE